MPVEPLVEAGDLLYTGPWVAERLAVLEAFLDAHPDAVLPVIRDVVRRGRDFTAVDTFRARHRLQELRAECNRAWLHADVLLMPTVPTTFTRAQLAADPVARNLVLGRFTQFANLLDLAAVAVPTGSPASSSAVIPPIAALPNPVSAPPGSAPARPAEQPTTTDSTTDTTPDTTTDSTTTTDEEH